MFIENNIDDMLQQVFMIKTFYHEQAKRTRRPTRKQKLSQIVSPTKQQSKSMESSYVNSTSPRKLNQPNFFSTFVNIKDARYQIGPTQSYNLKKIQFPDIGTKKSRSPKLKQSPEDFIQLSGSLNFTNNSSFKLLKRSHVKQSWNKYINLNYLNKSFNKIQSKEKFNKKFYQTTNKNFKDRTEENIEGWSSVYNPDDQINVVSRA